MKLAVTGGRGRVGQAIVARALAEGHIVVSIDTKVAVADTQAEGFSQPVVDGRDYAALRDALSGCDALIHAAAIPGPNCHPAHEVHNNNVLGSYNALFAAVDCGITRICQISSINAIGIGYSRAPRFDYFPIDEAHPTYCEDPYSLSKWICEQQGDCLARRYEKVSIASLRFHFVCDDRNAAAEFYNRKVQPVGLHLWGYTPEQLAVEACMHSLTADFTGHEVFFVTAPETFADEDSGKLVAAHFPSVPLTRPLPGRASFFSTSKAEKLLGLSYHKE